MIRTIMAAALVVCTTAGITAQSPGPRFEVASVRLSDPATPPRRTITDARLDLISYPLAQVLMIAFRVESYRLVAPDWVREVRVSIQASYPPGAGREQVSEMLQALLRERFGLVARFEARPIDVYEMVIGRDGIKMRDVAPVDELARKFPEDAGTKPIMDTTSSVGFPGAETQQRIIALSRGTRVITARSSWRSTLTDRRTWQIEAERMSMPELATTLAARTDRPVVDKTGLTGVYQFNVELPRMASTARMVQQVLGGADRNGNPIEVEPSSITAEKAVESLGLELKKRRSPTDVLVIDKLERTPTEN